MLLLCQSTLYNSATHVCSVVLLFCTYITRYITYLNSLGTSIIRLQQIQYSMLLHTYDVFIAPESVARGKCSNCLLFSQQIVCAIYSVISRYQIVGFFAFFAIYLHRKSFICAFLRFLVMVIFATSFSYTLR